MSKPRTPAEVRQEFTAYGVSISDWCRQRGFSRMSVVDLLRGHGMGLRGDSHRAAVALGLKPDPKTKKIHHPFEETQPKERQAA